MTLVQDDTKIRLKLLGDQSDIIDGNYVGQSALIKNIVIDRYKGANTLATTDQTEISVCKSFSFCLSAAFSMYELLVLLLFWDKSCRFMISDRIAFN